MQWKVRQLIVCMATYCVYMCDECDGTLCKSVQCSNTAYCNAVIVVTSILPITCRIALNSGTCTSNGCKCNATMSG